jgi:hypothetical protein
MAVQFGVVNSGTTASSAFVLSATDRTLVVGVSSHAALLWYASFANVATGPFLRYLDPWSSVSGALLAVAGGGFGTIPYPPTTTVRIETSAAVSATTSVQLVEVVRAS